MKKIMVLDNYDSFTYNLVHYIEAIVDHNIAVFRNDQIPLEKVDEYDKIVLSPGPGVPDQAGILKPLIARYAATKSILGVCLGVQAIGEVFGGKLLNLTDVYHGVATEVDITDESEILFRNMPRKIKVGRYHSWVVDAASLPDSLKVTSLDHEGQIMGLRHKQYDVAGVQFHPESVMTEHGKQMIANWLYA